MTININSYIKTLAPILLTAMFFFSGYHKIGNFDKTVSSFKSKFNINTSENVYKFIIILVIVLEILAPIIIGYHHNTGKYKDYAYYATWSLIIFTIFATVLYHPLDIENYYKSIAFWANLSLIGGLLLLLQHY